MHNYGVMWALMASLKRGNNGLRLNVLASKNLKRERASSHQPRPANRFNYSTVQPWILLVRF